MFTGFKDFLLRGNVIDLSVAVVMGAAFSAIVSAFTDKIIRPLLNAITPPTSPGLGIELVAGKPSTTIDIAAVISALINFVVVAAVVYFVIVLPMRTIQERRRRGEEAGPSEPSDIELLTQIRDLLGAQAARSEQPDPTTTRQATSGQIPLTARTGTPGVGRPADPTVHPPSHRATQPGAPAVAGPPASPAPPVRARNIGRTSGHGQ